MNKTIIAIIAIVVILGGGYWYYASQNSKTQESQEQVNNISNNSSTVDDSTSDSNPVSTNMSLKDLAQSHKNQKCTFSTLDNGNSSTGTTYISHEGKYRVDFTSTTASNQTFTGHNIFTGGSEFYFWMDGQTQGYKYDVGSYENMAAATEQSFNPDTKNNYSCEAWSTDNSKFVLPANIKFVSFAELMNQMR